MKNYETVFILTPVLSDDQIKDAVDKVRKVLKDNGADIVNDESWGLKRLAYPIQHKSTGYYHLFEYSAKPEIVDALEISFRRDEKIMRFLTVALDKHAVIYNARRKAGEFNKKSETKKEEAKA